LYVLASFEYSEYLELAISELELKGIKRERILAVPLGKKTEKAKIFDTISQSDGISLIDSALILGTVFMVLGVIYGYVLKWGPIIWGLIGLIAGAVLGFIIDIIPKKKGQNNKKKVKNKTTEVVILVHCDTNQVDEVENTLMSNFALGIGRLDKRE